MRLEPTHTPARAPSRFPAFKVVRSCQYLSHCSNDFLTTFLYGLDSHASLRLMLVQREASETPLVVNAIAALRELVCQPAYAGGAKLPSEPEVARKLGISRPVLRKALAVLKNEGLIESRRGSGTYSSGRRPAIITFDRPESLAELEDCMRFRMVIESAAAAEAARRKDAGAVKEIRCAITRMEKGRHLPAGVLGGDMDFHLAVARAARSRYYLLTLNTLKPHIMFGLNLARQLNNIPPDVVSKRVIAEHRAVLSAIEKGNEEKAAAAMRYHLLQGIDRIFKERSW